MVFYLSSRGRHSGEIGRNLRYKSWFNYIGTLDKEAPTPLIYTDQQTSDQKTALERGKWPKYLCCPFQAGLGDQLFSFASSYGIAKEKRRILVTKKHILPMFTLHTNGSVIERGDFDDICSKNRRNQKTLANQFLKKDLADSIVVLDNHLHSWKYFQKVEMQLREMFVFREGIVSEAQRILHEIKEEHFRNKTIPKNLTFVGMHVKRSGVGIPLKYFRLAPRSYFAKAMILFKRNFRDAIFVVVSDSKSWCRENLPDNIHVINENSSADLDMSVLSQCNHTIISGGPFGWWSAWLAKGMTTYFVPSIKSNSLQKAIASATYSEFYWPGWIPITAKDYASANAYKEKDKLEKLSNKKDKFSTIHGLKQQNN